MSSGQRSTKALGNGMQTFETIMPGTSQKLAISASSVQSAPVGPNTTVLRLFATNDCYILIGSNPTALADGTCMFIPGGIVDFCGILPGQILAVIQFAQNGYFFMTEGA